MNGSAALRWLDRERPDLGEARDAATRVVREAQRADSVIRGLRALVGNSGPQRDSLDLNDAMQEVLELARGELRRHGAAVQVDLAYGLPAAFGDRVQLQQVALNLILNGAEAMATVADRPKVLTVRTEGADPSGVAVVVEDAGPGLDPAIAGRIFEPFFTTKPNGLGMGLSICRSIVDAHGGKLSASPRSPYGTSFRFVVPTADGTDAAGGASPASSDDEDSARDSNTGQGSRHSLPYGLHVPASG
jgi:C4-dicarboxylate-specific signal transduction histidine kinase